MKWGTGGINIDACRIGNAQVGWKGNAAGGNTWNDKTCGLAKDGTPNPATGRFPSNFVLSHHPDCKCVGTKKVKGTATSNGEAPTGEESEGVIKPLRRGTFIDRTDENGLEEVEKWECVENCPIKELDAQSGISKSGKPRADRGKGGIWHKSTGIPAGPQYGDNGGASRFFYCAKASKKDRGEGNTHPTVKPVKLMEYLVRMITPQNGIVLDPFAGSGTTLLACQNEGFRRIGIEMNSEYCKIIEKRTGIKPLDMNSFNQA